MPFLKQVAELRKRLAGQPGHPKDKAGEQQRGEADYAPWVPVNVAPSTLLVLNRRAPFCARSTRTPASLVGLRAHKQFLSTPQFVTVEMPSDHTENWHVTTVPAGPS